MNCKTQMNSGIFSRFQSEMYLLRIKLNNYDDNITNIDLEMKSNIEFHRSAKQKLYRSYKC